MPPCTPPDTTTHMQSSSKSPDTVAETTMFCFSLSCHKKSSVGYRLSTMGSTIFLLSTPPTPRTFTNVCACAGVRVFTCVCAWVCIHMGVCACVCNSTCLWEGVVQMMGGTTGILWAGTGLLMSSNLWDCLVQLRIVLLKNASVLVGKHRIKHTLNPH